MSLTNDDRAALLLAADLCARYGRDGLGNRLRELARRPRAATRRPQPPQAPSPGRHVAGRPRSDVEAVAMVVRQLGDLDVYSLFMEAQRVRPSDLTALVWHRADQARRGRE